MWWLFWFACGGIAALASLMIVAIILLDTPPKKRFDEDWWYSGDDGAICTKCGTHVSIFDPPSTEPHRCHSPITASPLELTNDFCRPPIDR